MNVMPIEELVHYYNVINMQCFMSKLPLPSSMKFVYATDEMRAAGYTFVNAPIVDEEKELNIKGARQYSDDIKYVIAINPNICTTNREILSVLAHEMIHIYQFCTKPEKYAVPNTWDAAHNRLFVAKMNYVNDRVKEIGLDIKEIGVTFF